MTLFIWLKIAVYLWTPNLLLKKGDKSQYQIFTSKQQEQLKFEMLLPSYLENLVWKYLTLIYHRSINISVVVLNLFNLYLLTQFSSLCVIKSRPLPKINTIGWELFGRKAVQSRCLTGDCWIMMSCWFTLGLPFVTHQFHCILWLKVAWIKIDLAACIFSLTL